MVSVNCAPGKYDNGTDCVECDIGSYQDIEGQTECNPCPLHTTTNTTGANSETMCIGKN